MPKLTDANREILKKTSTATLTTVLYKRGLKNTFIQGIHRINSDAPAMVGEAYTLRYIPAREDLDSLDGYEDWEHPQRKAVEEVPEGHVLVMDSRKDARAASAGDILITRLMMRGAAGVRRRPDPFTIMQPTLIYRSAAATCRSTRATSAWGTARVWW